MSSYQDVVGCFAFEDQVSHLYSPYAIQLLLIDSEGGKIEATAKKGLIAKFKSQFVEDKVYKLVYFSVVPNDGKYRASTHEFKILLTNRTRVSEEVSEMIPHTGFTFTKSDAIAATGGESDNMFDMIGMVTTVQPERLIGNGHNATRMIVIELTDDRGKTECALYGEYVDMVKSFVEGSGQHIAVAVVQFVKVNTYMGKVVIQNVMNATRLYWNLEIAEAAMFRDT